jgi:hypothetical protein
MENEIELRRVTDLCRHKRPTAEFGTTIVAKAFGIFFFLGVVGGIERGDYVLALFSLVTSAFSLHSKTFLMEDIIRFRVFGPFKFDTPYIGYQYGEFMPFMLFAVRGWERRPIFFRFIHRDYGKFCKLLGIKP